MSTLNIGIRRTVFQLPTTIPFSYTYHSNIAHINITNYFFTVLVAAAGSFILGNDRWSLVRSFDPSFASGNSQ